MRKPNQCAILAVDTARNSGWALWCCGVRLDSGEVSTDDDDKLLRLCKLACARAPLRAVLVLETAWGGRPHTLLGLGAAREAWVKAWRKACNTKTTRRVVNVKPVVWRAPLGIRGKYAPRFHLDILASRDIHMTRPVGPDEFEAIMIGHWACHALKVARLLPEAARAV